MTEDELKAQAAEWSVALYGYSGYNLLPSNEDLIRVARLCIQAGISQERYEKFVLPFKAHQDSFTTLMELLGAAADEARSCP